MNTETEISTISHSFNQDHSAPQNDINSRNVVLSSSKKQILKNKGNKQRVTRQQWISVAAYFKAKARGFDAGNELSDWLEAEMEYLEMLITSYLSDFKEDGGMTKANLEQLANAIGIENPETMTDKKDLVQAIQKASKQSACFQDKGHLLCQDLDCKWRTECQKLVAEWLR